MGRLARWRGVLGLGLRRVWARASRTAPRQVAFTVTGVAVPVALLVVVSAVALGLAGGATVQSPDVDYWIVPESGSSTAVVPVGEPQLGGVHDAAARLAAREDVTTATPVLVEVVRAGGEFVIAVGVVPGDTAVTLAGTSTAALSPGDPHYADGTYDGTPTREAVLSPAAASLLSVGEGGSVELAASAASRWSFDVVAVSDTDDAGADLPVVLVRLSELQSLTGAADGDRATQLLVVTDDPGVRPALESLYPRSLVLERGGLGAGRVLDSQLALAVALSALAVALIVGVLFAATTLGLSVAASSHERAVLSALGVSGRSRAALVAVEALAVSLLGGLLGAVVGLAAVPLVNRFAARYVAEVAVARGHPLLAAYGLGVAGLIGLLVLPYLLVVSRRTTSVEALIE